MKSNVLIPRTDNAGMSLSPVIVEEMLVHSFDSLGAMLDCLVSHIKSPGRAKLFSLNIHGANIAHSNPRFKQVMQSADVMICDGMGIVLASRILTGQTIPCRLAAGDYMPALLERLAKERLTAFFLAGKPGVAEKALANLAKKVPHHTVIGCHHGYILNDAALEKQVMDTINRLQPDVLFVGFGMPLQEYWIEEKMTHLKVGAFFPFGATLDYISGTVPRCPVWLGNLGLEWLFRFWLEPARMFHRYIIGNPAFIGRQLWTAVRAYTGILPQRELLPKAIER
jgi:N-acetylglucosaminyldiphosphoundecaprenol N-acetyl-beta-D-mannosaminyltransferase